MLLAGDAGGFVNGFSAEGIYYAMVTGDLAAGAILRRALGRGAWRGDPAQARRAYVRAWRREIGAELRDSVLIQKYLFHSPPRMDRVVRAAQRRPVFSRNARGLRERPPVVPRGAAPAPVAVPAAAAAARVARAARRPAPAAAETPDPAAV